MLKQWNLYLQTGGGNFTEEQLRIAGVAPPANNANRVGGGNIIPGGGNSNNNNEANT